MKIRKSPSLTEQGFSLLEMLVTLALISVLLGTAIVNIKELDDPLANGSAQIISHVKSVRARAIAATSAYHIAPLSSGRIGASYSETCSDTTLTADPKYILDLPSGAYLSDTSWSFCITSRGLSDSNITFTLHDNNGATKTMEVLLGGAVREL